MASVHSTVVEVASTLSARNFHHAFKQLAFANGFGDHVAGGRYIIGVRFHDRVDFTDYSSFLWIKGHAVRYAQVFKTLLTQSAQSS